MATQYKDGTFGETKAFYDAHEEFLNAVEANTAKALVVGTAEEVEAQKKEAKEKVDLQALQDRVADLEAKHNTVITLPTREDIEKYCT